MAESFLESAVRRIREMTERISEARSRADELSRELSRERAAVRHGPLEDVKDVRPYSSPPAHEKGPPAHEKRKSAAAGPRHTTANDSSHRRRR